MDDFDLNRPALVITLTMRKGACESQHQIDLNYSSMHFSCETPVREIHPTSDIRESESEKYELHPPKILGV